MAGNNRGSETVQTPAPTVVVVDDDHGVLRFVAFALRHRGYQVLEATGGAEALDVVQNHPGPVHLLLTDVTMPGLDGPSLWQSLNGLRPEANVLFMSGHPEEGVRFNGFFLRKPFSASALIDKVQQTIR